MKEVNLKFYYRNTKSVSKRILYIEDDLINAFIMEKMLNKQFEFQHSEDGEKGLQALSINKFDLVLMDIHLGRGKMDGTETMKRIKSIPGYSQIPVIAVTSYALPEDEARFRAEGFDDYMAKPVDRMVLLQKIEFFLNKKQGK